MHEHPSHDSLTISRMVPNDRNTIYPLLATAEDESWGLWYLVDVPNIGRGWMDAVGFSPLECGKDQAGIIIDRTPIRFDGFANRDTFTLEIGTEGYIVGSRNNFIIFELLDGSTGLVHPDAVVNRSDDVVSVCSGVPNVVSGNTVGIPHQDSGKTYTPAPAPLPRITGNRVVVNTGNLNIRSGPAAGFGVVATVPGGTELAVLGRAPDGVWMYVEGLFGRGWINNQFVLFRGDYGTVPVLDLTGN
jgi:hypothetical protein